MLEPHGAKTRLLEQLALRRLARVLAPIHASARQLQREGAQRLAPLAHQDDPAFLREGHHGREPAALEHPVLDGRPAGQLHLVNPEGAPRVAVEVAPFEGQPAPFLHAAQYSERRTEKRRGRSPSLALRSLVLATRSSWRPWWCSSPCPRGPRPRGRWPPPGTPARTPRSRCSRRDRPRRSSGPSCRCTAQL